MRISNRFQTFAWIGAFMFAAASCPHAQASVIFTIQQVGSNVVETGSGTFNLAGFSTSSSATVGVNSNPSLGKLIVGAPGSAVEDLHGPITGPTNFGAGAQFVPTSGSGAEFGFSSSADVILVPTGYVSGSQLSGSSTIDNTTLSALGITPGSYTWTWGSGATADSLTVNAVASTPEPASVGLFAFGIGGLLLAALRKRAQTRRDR